jgi:hypothetical protein
VIRAFKLFSVATGSIFHSLYVNPATVFFAGEENYNDPQEVRGATRTQVVFMHSPVADIQGSS